MSVVTVLGLAIGAGLVSQTRALAEQQPASSARLPDTFGFGRTATLDDIARLDIDVQPDGTGLPPGSGTVAEGARTWERSCRGCHGAEGEGATAAPLVGRDPDSQRVTVGNYWPYATTLYDYINRAMPRPAPGTLTSDQIYGLVAWILAKNEILDEDAVMNAETLPAVVMPARDRFVPDDRRGGPEVR
jgi:cytochrome c